jgi:hypothetical protein
MQHRRRQLGRWVILVIAVAIPIVVGAQALVRLREPSDLVAGLGNGLLLILCVVVLSLLATVFCVGWLHKRCRRRGDAG